MQRACLLVGIGLMLLGGQVRARRPSIIASLLGRNGRSRQFGATPGAGIHVQPGQQLRPGFGGTDKPGWFANADRSQFVRIEEKDGRKEYVLMDEEGPGAVVRFWATWHGPGGGPFSNGTLRFYLDGNPQPVIEGPAASILDGGMLCSGPLSEGVSPQTDPRPAGAQSLSADSLCQALQDHL